MELAVSLLDQMPSRRDPTGAAAAARGVTAHPLDRTFARLLDGSRSSVADRIRNTADQDAAQMFEAKTKARAKRRFEEAPVSTAAPHVAIAIDQAAQPPKKLENVSGQGASGGMNTGVSASASQAKPDKLSPGGARGHARVEAASNTQPPTLTLGSEAPSARPGSASYVQTAKTYPMSAPPVANAGATSARLPTAETPARHIGQLLTQSGGEFGGKLSMAAASGQSQVPGASSKAAARTAGPGQAQASERHRGKAEAAEPEKTQFDQLIRSIHLQMGGRRSSARLRLDPPELGRIRVDVRIDGESVRVDVQTETEAARARLSERAEQLKVQLAEHGIRVERFEIVLNSHDHPTSSANPFARDGGDAQGGQGRGSFIARYTDSLGDVEKGRISEGAPLDDECAVRHRRRLDVRV